MYKINPPFTCSSWIKYDETFHLKTTKKKWNEWKQERKDLGHCCQSCLFRFSRLPGLSLLSVTSAPVACPSSIFPNSHICFCRLAFCLFVKDRETAKQTRVHQMRLKREQGGLRWNGGGVEDWGGVGEVEERVGTDDYWRIVRKWSSGVNVFHGSRNSVVKF